jgi:hypothetical protein
MDIFIHLNINPLSWDMPDSEAEAPPPPACASLCRRVRLRDAVKDGRQGASRGQPPLRPSQIQTATEPQVSLASA